MEKYVKYRTSDVCCSMISYDIEDDTVNNIIFHGGCPGGLSALAKALNGRKIEEVINLMKNIKCGNRDSSCPVELVKSLRHELELIKNLPDEKEIPYSQKILDAQELFVNKSGIDLLKYKMIVHIRPDIYEKLNEELNEMTEKEKEEYLNLFDSKIYEDENITQDEFIITTEKL